MTGDWLGWGKAWAHKIVLERRKEVAPQLRDFAAAGELTIVENIGEDIEELADLVEQVYVSGLLARVDEAQPGAIGVDPVGIGAIVNAIVEREIPIETIIGISQGWKMVGAIKTTERKLAEGTMFHGNQRIMAWCCGNAKVEPRGNAIIITKQASGSAKIDPLLALFDAVHLMALNPDAGGKSFWETIGDGKSLKRASKQRLRLKNRRAFPVPSPQVHGRGDQPGWLGATFSVGAANRPTPSTCSAISPASCDPAAAAPSIRRRRSRCPPSSAARA
jgi:phage terminase large subunit-like protein